jgi:Arc/MetJ-type ribon-helix-helix transcriptional regulator
VESGRYSSPDDVIARALGLLEERDLADTDPAIEKELAEIRAKVMWGVDDLRNGRATRYDSKEQLVEDIRQRGLERLHRRKERLAQSQTEST